MNNKKIIRLLRQADAEIIAENWPFPDEKAGERIYAKRQNPGELPMEDIVQDEVLIERRSGAGRFAAIAAVCLLTVGTVGGIGLMRHMHSQEPASELTSAEEEQQISADAPSDPVRMPAAETVYAEDPVASASQEADSVIAVESEPSPQEPAQATESSQPATAPSKSTTPGKTPPAKDTVRETTAPTEPAQPETADRDAKLQHAYELLVPFAEKYEHMTVYRTAREYFEERTGVGLSGEDLDSRVLVVYPCNFADAYQREFNRFLQDNQIGDYATDYQSEPVYTEARITLAEAEQICRESDTALRAAECISQRYAADEQFGSDAVFVTYYMDDAKTESINILYDGGVIIFYKSPDESADMTAINHRILTADGNQAGTFLSWLRMEREKSDSVLTDEQKAQLRALDEEEKSLWTTSYIRRRLEIMGAMSPNAPRPTIEDVEYFCAHSGSPELAARNLKYVYVPDYSWGSGVSGLAYRLSDTETINIVDSGGISIYYENTATGERRDFCE